MSNNVLILIARVLLSFMFIFAGFGKITDPASTAGMIAGAGLPAATALTYLAGLFELAAGLAVLVGFQVRIVGWLLAVFCVFTGFVFHFSAINVPDFPAAANAWLSGLNFVNFLKNITLAGAYIMLATNGAGAYSLDARRGAYAAA
ncbi:DoxX family protein [Rhizobium etli]|uniref:DoxX family protein n=1 Tax=Rhizobium etli TaxID=29449 RepID=UPI0003838F63|nr:DoxX family protein [Rhizobium etli]AGS20683.1 DoxX family protein [Rhizobium etli bv. mimosae str. Mim1]